MANFDGPIQINSHTRITPTSIIYASLAGIVISGPLLCITGLILFATSAFLVFISPLLIIFSPLLFLAGVVLLFSLLGFAAAVGMAVAGMSAIGWTMKAMNRGKVGVFLGDPVKSVADTGRDWAEYLQTKVGQDNLNETHVNRG